MRFCATLVRRFLPGKLSRSSQQVAAGTQLLRHSGLRIPKQEATISSEVWSTAVAHGVQIKNKVEGERA
jgi:hypothetical protein